MMLNSNWKEVKLGDLLNFRRGHDLPKTSLNKGMIPVVGSNGIIGYHDTYTTKAPCLTVGRSGNIGKPNYINENCWAHNTTLYVDNFKGNNPLYLYYLLQTLQLSFYGGGSAVPTLNRNHIHPIKVKTTLDYNEQAKIANFLKQFDDKIEVIKGINDNLDQQMQTLFREQFQLYTPYQSELIDSDLGKIPTGWKIVSLGDVCTKITDGSHYSPKDITDADIPMFSVKDMEQFGFNYTFCKHIDDIEFNKMLSNDCVPQIDDILVAKDGSYLKEIFICNKFEKMAILSSIAIFRPNHELIYPEILLTMLKSPAIMQEVRDNFVSGSALPRIVLKDFKKLRFVLPPIEEQHKIADFLISARKTITNNINQIKHLTSLRDTLFPKLMSGQLDISGIDV